MIELKSLTNSIVEYLRAAIISGELPGGMRLSEPELSLRLNVSRPPLREALQIMEQQYLIRSTARKGRYVVELSEENYRINSQCREMVECYAITLLERKQIRSVPIIRDNLKALESLPSSVKTTPERINFLEKVFRFHRELIASTENELLMRFYSVIRDNINRYLFIEMFQSETPYVRIEEHKEIYSLIESGSYDKAREKLIAHIEEARNSVLHILSLKKKHRFIMNMNRKNERRKYESEENFVSCGRSLQLRTSVCDCGGTDSGKTNGVEGPMFLVSSGNYLQGL